MFNANDEQMRLAQEVVSERISFKSLLKIVQLMGFAA